MPTYSVADCFAALENEPKWQAAWQILLDFSLNDRQTDWLKQQTPETGNSLDRWGLRWRSLNQFAVRWGWAQERAVIHRRLVEAQTDHCRPGALKLKGDRTPGVFIIGAQKSGTTALYSHLCQHPNFVPALVKEVHFFDKIWDEFTATGQFDSARDWYLSHFAPLAAGYITGEATPCYLADPAAPARLRAWFPGAKLIVILRDPTNRFISGYHHERRKRTEGRSLLQAVTEEVDRAESKGADWLRTYEWGSYLARSLYAPALAAWFAEFPREQFLILDSEDLLFRGQAAMARVCEFLGLPRHTLPSYHRLHVGNYPAAEAEVRDRLNSFFAPHNEALQELLGRRLTWE